MVYFMAETYTYTTTPNRGEKPNMEALAFYTAEAQPMPQQAQEVQAANLEALAGQFIGYLDVSPKSIETYRASIRRLLEYLRSRNITHPTRGDILQYRERMKRKNRRQAVMCSEILLGL